MIRAGPSAAADRARSRCARPPLIAIRAGGPVRSTAHPSSPRAATNECGPGGTRPDRTTADGHRVAPRGSVVGSAGSKSFTTSPSGPDAPCQSRDEHQKTRSGTRRPRRDHGPLAVILAGLNTQTQYSENFPKYTGNMIARICVIALQIGPVQNAGTVGSRHRRTAMGGGGSIPVHVAARVSGRTLSAESGGRVFSAGPVRQNWAVASPLGGSSAQTGQTLP